MKKAPFYLLLCLTLCFSISGCGGGETQVIEAPTTNEDPVMEGMDEDEYNNVMNQQDQEGN